MHAFCDCPWFSIYPISFMAIARALRYILQHLNGLDAEYTTSHYLNQPLFSLLKHIWITRPAAINQHCMAYRDPFHYRFIHHNSNLMEILFCSKSHSNAILATKNCIGHNNYAVVGYAGCSNLMAESRITAKRYFNRIWKKLACT